MNNPNHLHFWT